MDIRDKSRSQRNSLEQLISVIPGFGGYFEREVRREADAIQRRYIATTLDDFRITLSRRTAQEKDLARVGDWGKVDQALTRVAQTIRFAEYGFSGFFDIIKIKDMDLDRIYETDAEILDTVLTVKELDLNAIEPAALLEQILALETAFEKRKSVMEEIS